MSEEIHKGMYYRLTDEDRKYITKYFNERDLKQLIEFCEALAIAASCAVWENAELYLKDVGVEKFFQDCRNCGHTFDCDSKFAINECGNRYVKWIPPTKDQEERLKKLQRKVNG